MGPGALGPAFFTHVGIFAAIVNMTIIVCDMDEGGSPPLREVNTPPLGALVLP